MNKKDIINWLNERNFDACQELFDNAYQVKKQNVGSTVYFRGIIELSNICQKNCFYCGIRKASNAHRYMMTMDEIRECAQFAYKQGYGSVVLQAGEQSSENYIEFINKAIICIKEVSSGVLGITLSLGEQKEAVYQKWFDSGAHRYLLRVETTNEKLYGQLHPIDHDFRERKECLRILKNIGYQVGTGVMIGLPGQTVEDLYEDISFFESFDIDMIGMGPFIPHDDTQFKNCKVNLRNNFFESLKMIALTRLQLPDINIAATTALQAIDPIGREKALQVGANVIMPNITPQKYRSDYQLYNNKPCISEESSLCQSCLSSRIKNIGESIGFNEWGDSLRFQKRTLK